MESNLKGVQGSSWTLAPKKKKKGCERSAHILISGIYLEELRMATNILGIVCVPAKIRNTHLANDSHNA
jgi:hypothetical protein